MDGIRAWLLEELAACPADAPGLLHDGVQWTQTHGFRRAFHVHGVYRGDGGRHAFHVEPDDRPCDPRTFPNMGAYASWEAMLDGVAARYERLWARAA